MDIVSYFNCIPKEFLEKTSKLRDCYINYSDYESYLDCLTRLGEEKELSTEEAEKLNDRFTEYIINEWKNNYDKIL